MEAVRTANPPVSRPYGRFYSVLVTLAPWNWPQLIWLTLTGLN